MKQYILDLSLIGTIIRRRISISGEVSFEKVHNIIQTIFGWGNEHLHKFVVGDLEIGDYAEEDSLPDNYSYEGDVCLEAVLENIPEIYYEYDFGDNWRVLIKVEDTKEVSENREVKVLEAVGGMAQENCGGVSGLKVNETVEMGVSILNDLLQSLK